MTHMNGHEFEFGRLMGQILERSERNIALLERQNNLIDRQNSTMVEMLNILAAMPHVLSERIARPAGKEGNTIRDITELIKAAAPIVVFTLVIAGKSAFPQALPVIREILNVAGGGH